MDNRLALIGALASSTIGWAQEGPPGGSGIKFEHNFNGATIVSNQSLNANVAGVAFSGNSANFNSSSSTSNSCAGICVIGNKISGGQQKPPSCNGKPC